MKTKGEQPNKKVEANDFPGVFLLQDPVDLPPGAAQDQLNLKSDSQGAATVRGGCLPVSFEYSA